ncbi:hypothetical protein GALL_344920 [mine drainage metagenome]|uniref:NAD-specific glutamate dehydrogenase n=1 Tax=mine drainage metagenome TaxID=410659 RepID=A0A1J5QJN2_9ZZZZ
MALLVEQLDLRPDDLGRAAPLGVDHNQRGQAGDLVQLLDHGHAFLDVFELHPPGVLGDDGAGERIPAGQCGAGLDRHAVLHEQQGAVGNLVALAFAAVIVGDEHLAGAGDGHLLALGVGDVAHGGGEACRARALGLDAGNNRRARSCAADVEGAHGQLRAGFADGLGGNHADSLAGVDQHAAAQVAAIALGAHAVAGFAGEGGAHLDFVDAGGLDQIQKIFIEHVASRNDHFLCLGVGHIGRRDAAEHAVAQGFDDFTALDQRAHRHAVRGAAIVLGDDQILRHVDQAAGEVTGVGGLQRRVGQALTRAVGGDEVLQHVEAFTEIRRDRRFDDGAVRFGHQAAHAGELANLCRGAARAGVGHHVDGVERFLAHLLAMTVGDGLGGEAVHQRLAHFVAGTAPDVHDLVVALALGDQAGGVLLGDFLDFLLGMGNEGVLFIRNQHVVHADGNAGTGRQGETRLQKLVGEDHGVAQPAAAERRVDQARDFLFLQRLVHHAERQPLGQDFRQQGAARRGFHDHGLGREGACGLVALVFGQAHADARGDLQVAGLQRAVNFTDVGKHHAFAFAVDALTGGVVQAQHHVLGGDDGGLAVGGEQHVVGSQHQRAGLHLRFQRQRHVHGHLVAVEVGVEGGANEGMQLDGLALDQHRLEGLDAQAVERGGSVEHHRMLADDLFQDVPHDRGLGVHFLLRRLDGGGHAQRFQAVEDEGLEQLQRHQLGQSALVQLERGADHDDRAARVVDALAQQVLAETAALALDHVGQGLERALVLAHHGLAAAAVVQQRIHRFLQHALFVAHDDFRRLEFEQAAQAVVAVDDAAIQVVEVAGGEAAAVQWDQRTQVGREHRQDGEHHPLGFGVGFAEGVQHLEALGVLLHLGVRTLQVAAQRADFLFQVHVRQQVANALGAHEGDELIAEFLAFGGVLVLRQHLALGQRGHARIGDHIGFEIQHALDVPQRHVENHAQARGQALEEPDVGHGRGQLDVAHAVAAHLALRHFDAALLADHAAVLQALVLAAQALVVLDRAEDLGAEQAVALGLERAVVDGLRLLDFTE